MTHKPLSALERELINNGFRLNGGFGEYQFWSKGDEGFLYDTENRELIYYKKDDEIYEYIMKWSRIKSMEVKNG